MSRGRKTVAWGALATIAVAVIGAALTLHQRVSALEVRVDERRDDITEIRAAAKRTDENVAAIYQHLIGHPPPNPPRRTP